MLPLKQKPCLKHHLPSTLQFSPDLFTGSYQSSTSTADQRTKAHYYRSSASPFPLSFLSPPPKYIQKEEQLTNAHTAHPPSPSPQYGPQSSHNAYYARTRAGTKPLLRARSLRPRRRSRWATRFAERLAGEGCDGGRCGPRKESKRAVGCAGLVRGVFELMGEGCVFLVQYQSSLPLPLRMRKHYR